MKKADTKNKSKIIVYIIFILIFAAIALIVGMIVGTVIGNPLGTPININNMLASLKKKESLMIAGIIFFIEMVGLLAYLIKYKQFSFRNVINRVDRADNDLHGNSRFLSEKEIKNKFGYISFKDLPNAQLNGIVVKSEKIRDQLFVSSIQKHHALCVAPTGGGKTKFALGPTIQANAQSGYKASLIINDLKGDLYNDHSKILKDSGYNVVCINLRTPRKSIRWNPLDLIWDLYHQHIETGDMELLDKVSAFIVEMSEIVCPPGTGDNMIWANGSQSIITGLLWAMLEDSLNAKYKMTKNKFTFAQLSNILNKQSDYLMDFLTHRPPTSRVFDYAGLLISAKESEKTFASYLSNTQNNLKAFLDTGIQYITSGSDFDIQLITEKPTAIFLIIPDENRTRYVLANLMITQLYNYLTLAASQNVNQALKRRVYFMLDEFAQMPKMPNIAQWLSVSRSREIFFFLIVQSVSQFKSLYGENDCETILQNCTLKMYLGGSEPKENKYFQELFGSFTVYQRSASISQTTLENINYAGTTGMTKKELVNLDELATMKPGDLYFVLAREFPCKSSLVPIFDDDLKDRKVFKLGCIDTKIEEKKIDFMSTFFNIEEREASFSFERYVPSVITVNTVSTEMPVNTTGFNTERFEETEEDLEILETTGVYDDEGEEEGGEPLPMRQIELSVLSSVGLIDPAAPKQTSEIFDINNIVNLLKEAK